MSCRGERGPDRFFPRHPFQAAQKSRLMPFDPKGRYFIVTAKRESLIVATPVPARSWLAKDKGFD
jgi:hypothetical protein